MGAIVGKLEDENCGGNSGGTCGGKLRRETVGETAGGNCGGIVGKLRGELRGKLWENCWGGGNCELQDGIKKGNTTERLFYNGRRKVLRHFANGTFANREQYFPDT